MSIRSANLAIPEPPSPGWYTICSNLLQMEHKLQTGQKRVGIRRFEWVNLPSMDVFRDDGIGPRVIFRTQRHIEVDQVRDYIVVLPLTSRSVISQNGQNATLDPGNFAVIPTDAPFVGTVSGINDRKQFSQIIARIPGNSLRKLMPGIEAGSHLSIPFQPGAGNLLAMMMEWALKEGAYLSKSQGLLFCRSLLETLVGALTEAPKANPTKVAGLGMSHARVREQAMEFISSHISDPMLNVAMIAGHCGVSERYLHAAFAAASLKVGTYIRQFRLEQCRAALTNPANRWRSINSIAMNWGFVDPNSFSRSYKAWCGKTPQQERAAS